MAQGAGDYQVVSVAINQRTHVRSRSSISCIKLFQPAQQRRFHVVKNRHTDFQSKQDGGRRRIGRSRSLGISVFRRCSDRCLSGCSSAVVTVSLDSLSQ